jgi:hypothetical protein
LVPAADGRAAVEFRRITLLFDRPADAGQAIESTSLLNFGIFAGHFAALSRFSSLSHRCVPNGHVPVRPNGPDQ